MSENKNEGRLKILEMLSEGKISATEAMELLKQFSDEEKAEEKTYRYGDIDPRQINPNKTAHKGHNEDDGQDQDQDQDFSGDFATFGQRIKDGIESITGLDLSDLGNDIRESLEDVDITIDIGDIFRTHRHQSSITYVSDPITQNIQSLKLLGKNSKVEIEGYDGKELRITCKFSAKRPDAQVFVNENEGNYELLYDYNGIRSMQVFCQVPRVFVEEIHGESKNSSIELRWVNARNVDLLTKNSNIKVEGVQASQIAAKTSNSAIYGERLTADFINFETSNSKIDVENITADIARFTTSNSRVSTEDVDVKHLYIKTSNAGIKMERAFKYTSDAWDTERTIEASTSNGTVTIYVPREVESMVRASTSNGRVDCDLQHMLIGEISKNYVNGRTQNYETAAKKAKIDVRTSNASIKIKEA